MRLRSLLVPMGILALGCAGPAPCPTAEGCPEGTVCRLDGTCGPLARATPLRFARTRSLESVDWGVRLAASPSRVPPDTDLLPVGGPTGASVHLAFGPMPFGGTVLRAILVLTLARGPDESARIVVARTDGFDGDRLTGESAPAPAGAAPVLATLHPGPSRTVHVDVTSLLPKSSGAEDRFSLLLRNPDLDRAGTLAFASPRAEARHTRPRLHVLAEPRAPAQSALAGVAPSL